MKNTNKQNTDQENSDSLLNERQDEARNERSECSCPQSSGSPFDLLDDYPQQEFKTAKELLAHFGIESDY